MKKIYQTPKELVNEYSTCPYCNCERDIMHIKALPKEPRKLIRDRFGKDTFVVFCPECEDMGYIKG